jgi:hypothetical protein
MWIELQSQLTQGQRGCEYEGKVRVRRIIVVCKVCHIEHERVQRHQRALWDEPRAEWHKNLVIARNAQGVEAEGTG